MSDAIHQRMSFVTVGARDVKALSGFYKGLGWKPAIESDDFASFLVGGVVLGLYELAYLSKEVGLEPASGWSGMALAYNVETREEVDGAYAAWVAAGATPLVPPRDHPYGPRSGHVADPEGNVWEIAWADGLEWNDRGAITKFG